MNEIILTPPYDTAKLSEAQRFDWLLFVAVAPACAKLAMMGGPKQHPHAKRMLLAMAGQESRILHRDQITAVPMLGPALGFWQCERGGGAVHGVLNHKLTAGLAKLLCAEAGILHTVMPTGEVSLATKDAVWRRFLVDDLFAACFARLLLWTDPRTLPQTMDAGWASYLETWRPGKPHKATWAAQWNAADAAVFRAA